MEQDWRDWPRTLAIVAGLATTGCQSMPSIWTKGGPGGAPPATAQATHTPNGLAPRGATSGSAPPVANHSAPGLPGAPGFPPPGGETPRFAGKPPAGAPPGSPSPGPPAAGSPASGPGAAGLPVAWSAPAPASPYIAFDPPAPGTEAAAEQDGEVLEPAKIVARVGEQVILAGDIDGTVNIILALQFKDLPPEEKERAAPQIEAFRRQVFKQILKNEVSTKLGYIDFMRTVPNDKHSEIQKKIKANFEKELDDVRTKLAAVDPEDKEQQAEIAARNMVLARLAHLMQNYRLDNLGELDGLLRTLGSSLDKQVRAYGEQKLHQMSVMRNIKQNVEITHEQMLEYYHAHLTEFAIPAKAKWEQLTVRFDRFPNEDAALAALSEMGNAVYLGGASFAAVAKKSSQEPNADDGGLHDWTQKGSLASKPMDEAIFTLPTGKLSPIIRDDRGLHIIRVLERSDAGHTSFLDAQTGIREKIRGERRNKDVLAYLEKLKTSIPVWTIDDADPAAAAAPSRAN